VWSRALQLQAELPLYCSLASSPPRDPYNINTNIGLSARGNITTILLGWMLEKQHFIPQLATCIRLQECKRFLTMIHAQHRAIGCAFTNQCRVGNAHVNLLVCKYGTSEGPIVPAYKTGLPCTKCKEDVSFCEQGLCVSCSHAANRCDCRKTCNKQAIGSGSLDNTTCTCTCEYGLGPNCDEDCVNPEMYEDWDVCAAITHQDCQTADAEERAILREMCPVQCTCSRHPEASLRQNDANAPAKSEV
ncbi:uncharacterized protein LOC110460035, partial [Mizuhopecten yessoensis]|uniref:uncharacterized protein LOC110460035 n=1 Tax=Mizuhopecten yessoensis TaxID=6573 RepID=UPI000B45B566